MTELFESTIDNVSEIEFSGHSDPEMRDRVIEVWAKSGDEEYIYRFKGPGVELNVLSKIDTENEKLKEKNGELAEENEKLKEEGYILRKDFSQAAMEIRKLKQENEELKKENEDFGNQILDYIEMNNRMMREKEEHALNAVSAKEKNKMLEIENEKLKKELHSLKQEKTNIPKTPQSRSDILKAAEKCVCGQREQDYGTPESNFQLIADLWNDYLKKERLGRSKAVVDAVDVSMMMALMKIARIRNGGGSGDSFVDLAGYAACGGEIWHGERHSDK